jgi:hypothetical protein
MTLQTPLQRGARQLRDRCLQRIEEVIQREQRMLAKCDNQRFFLQRQVSGARLVQAHRHIVHMRPLFPLAERLWIEMGESSDIDGEESHKSLI